MAGAVAEGGMAKGAIVEARVEHEEEWAERGEEWVEAKVVGKAAEGTRLRLECGS